MNHHNALFKLGIATWLSKSMQESQFYNKIEELLEVCWKWVKNYEELINFKLINSFFSSKSIF